MVIDGRGEAGLTSSAERRATKTQSLVYQRLCYNWDFLARAPMAFLALRNDAET
jgi:hypothetical protein